ncbi:MAG: hypothetical protein DWQ06_16640 [Calditrichaeota bacterium]|nr:MAG: hypothetical protein DWQ06_16640 [Calditrichota bacterium]
MIVKTKRWKNTNFKKLINYINEDKGRADKEAFSIFHNIKFPTVHGAVKSFRENDKFRKKRKNGVAIYHEVLSFSEKDTEQILLSSEYNLNRKIFENKYNLNRKILEKLFQIASQYIEIRGKNALCYAKPHLSDKNIHIHFAFSGTEYRSQKTLRMSNKRFLEVRKGIEKFQMEKFPEIENSIVYHKEKKEKTASLSDREFQLKRRVRKKQTDKEKLKILFQTVFNFSKSFDDFVKNLSEKNFEIYTYRGKTQGVIYKGRKYRFKTLGFEREKFFKIHQVEQELTKIRKSRSKGRGLSRSLTK